MKKKLAFAFVCMLMFSFKTVSVAAEEFEGLGFTYENLLPDNQQGEVDYFDLKVKPDSEQVLETKITNTTDEPLTVQVLLGNAGTTSEGSINYLSPEKLAGKIYLTDIASAPKELELKPAEEKILKITLKIPKEGFSGLIMGGVDLAKKGEAQNEQKKSGVNNRFSYLYSISLIQDDHQPKPILESSDSSYDTENQQLETGIINKSGSLVKELVLKRKVIEKKNNDVIQSVELEKLKMAPNSTFHFKGEPLKLKPGIYRIYTVATVGEKSWEWEDELEISDTDQLDTSESVELTEVSRSFKQPLLILGGLILILSGIIFVIFHLFSKKI